ncbi:matrix protein [Fox fecal rhabdovirus]|uniref:Matrix protein n=1 Tax=Fox fecal rhabdovirus TaxID=1504569 RepID=A0A060DA07_9RHAB|nr:matrix protein [Fox fecal rhabdovirus]AIB06807.1 matrix protein [Fox fecal rhabdovirus]
MSNFRYTLMKFASKMSLTSKSKYKVLGIGDELGQSNVNIIHEGEEDHTSIYSESPSSSKKKTSRTMRPWVYPTYPEQKNIVRGTLRGARPKKVVLSINLTGVSEPLDFPEVATVISDILDGMEMSAMRKLVLQMMILSTRPMGRFSDGCYRYIFSNCFSTSCFPSSCLGEFMHDSGDFCSTTFDDKTYFGSYRLTFEDAIGSNHQYPLPLWFHLSYTNALKPDFTPGLAVCRAKGKFLIYLDDKYFSFKTYSDNIVLLLMGRAPKAIKQK